MHPHVSFVTNHVLSELVRSSTMITIWIVGGQAPITIRPCVDSYIGTLALGSTVLAGFNLGAVYAPAVQSSKHVWVNVDTISRIDTEPLPRAESPSPELAGAPAQVE